MRDTFFELIQIEVQCSKNYFKIYLPQEAGAFGNNMPSIKNCAKATPKIDNYAYYLFTENIFSPCNPM